MWALVGKERCLLQSPTRLGSIQQQHGCCPFIYWTRNSHITSRGTGLRNISTWPTLHYLGQEQRAAAVAVTSLPPVLYCVLARSCILSPLPNRISAELTGPAHPHRAIPRPNLVISHLPASPCSPLSSVSFVTFWAGRDANALWSFPLSQPRPVWHAARIRARPQEPQGPPREGCIVPMGPLVTCGALDP